RRTPDFPLCPYTTLFRSKLASVASDVLGISGRAMLEALLLGTTDPAMLAELARGRLRGKLPALRQALAGRFRGHHAFLIGQLLRSEEHTSELQSPDHLVC